MEREQFLRRISERHGRELLTQAPFREQLVIPTPDIDRARLAERFTAEMETVGGYVVTVSNITDAGVALRRIIFDQNAPNMVTWERDAFDHWAINWIWDELGAVSVTSKLKNSRSVLLEADIGITLGDFAVAETGSLVLLTSPNSARSVSLTPNVHIALLESRNIVPTAEDVFDKVSSGNYLPSSIHFITGPSRSADIENDLSIGVHGPSAVYVILLQ